MKNSTKRLTVIGLCSAMLCIIAPFTIPLPVSPVPVSLAPLMIFISAYILSTSGCTLCVLVYLLIGAVGLPVFSGFTGGIGIIAGPTGGFLIGYLATAFVSSFFLHKSSKSCIQIAGMVLGLGCSYLTGTVWFSLQQNVNFMTAATLCVVPYIAGDVLKIAAAFILGKKLQKTDFRL